MPANSIVTAIESHFKVTFKDVTDERNGCQVKRNINSGGFFSPRKPYSTWSISINQSGDVTISAENTGIDNPDHIYAKAQHEKYKDMLKFLKDTLGENRVKTSFEFKEYAFCSTSTVESFTIMLSEYITLLNVQGEVPYTPKKRRETVIKPPQVVAPSTQASASTSNPQNESILTKSQKSASSSSSVSASNTSADAASLQSRNNRPIAVQPNPRAIRKPHLELFEALGQHIEKGGTHTKLAQTICDLIGDVKAKIKNKSDYYPQLWVAIKLAISEYESDTGKQINMEEPFYQDLLSDKMVILTPALVTPACRVAISMHSTIEKIDWRIESNLQNDWVSLGGLLSDSDNSLDSSEETSDERLHKLRRSLSNLTTTLLMNQDIDATMVLILLDAKVLSDPGFDKSDDITRVLLQNARALQQESLTDDLNLVRQTLKDSTNNNNQHDESQECLTKIEETLERNAKLHFKPNRASKELITELKELKVQLNDSLEHKGGHSGFRRT